MSAPVAPRSKLWLYLISALIIACGVLAAWTFRNQKPQKPAQHPETAYFQSLDSEREWFLALFRSQDPETLVVAPLRSLGLGIERKVLKKPVSIQYPPRTLVTVTVTGFKHLGDTGTLRLEFLNDRLMEADFQPNNPGRYASALHQEYPALARDAQGHAEMVSNHLRIFSNIDLARSSVGDALDAKPLVVWQDLRLIRQRDDWDARFGGIVIRATPENPPE